MIVNDLKKKRISNKRRIVKAKTLIISRLQTE